MKTTNEIKHLAGLIIFIGCVLTTANLYACAELLVNDAYSTTLPADGESTAVVRVMYRLSSGVPWEGQPVTLSLSPDSGYLENSTLILNSSGFGWTVYHPGDEPDAVTLTAVFHEGTVRTANIYLFGVDIESVKPDVICLDKDKKIKKDVIIKYKIEPPEYTASTVHVEILEDDTVIETLEGANKLGEGTATWIKGSEVESAELTKKYDVQIVLNKDTDREYRSEKFLIRIVPPWIIDVMTIGDADHEDDSRGILKFRVNTIHESQVDIDRERIKFLAYSFGHSIKIGKAEIPIGGSCWASGVLGGEYFQNISAKVKIYVIGRLFGEIYISVPGFADFDIQLKIDDKNYRSLYSEEKESVKYDGDIFEFSKIIGTMSADTHKILVKFTGDTSAFGEGGLAAVQFNDRYEQGYFIFVDKIIIEALDVKQ